MLKDFKKFVLRGNTVDLAVAVVIGAAFGTIVTSLVKDLITPLLAAVGGQPDFSKLTFTINGSKFLYGDFINAVIGFLIISAVIFFLVIQPINKMTAIASRNKITDDPTTKKCPECLSEVPIKATRCAHCQIKLKA
ncbi:MAG: large conductance mechanosensitive channel protein MscL [Candidatus Saccharimonadales bacterium]